MRISDWSSDVCSSDLIVDHRIEVSIGHDDAVVLGAALRLHALAVFHPAPINVMRDVRAADEAYRRNPRMLEDCIDHFLVATHSLKDRKSTRLNSSHYCAYRMQSPA